MSCRNPITVNVTINHFNGLHFEGRAKVHISQVSSLYRANKGCYRIP